MVQEWVVRMNTEHEICCNDQGICSLYWMEMQSPLWVQLLFLIARETFRITFKTFKDYKSLSDLIFLKTYAVLITYS